MEKISNEIDRQNKIAAVTLLFWLEKIAATTLGETAGDLLSMTLHIGYGISSLLLIVFFVVVLSVQLFVKRYYPVLFWMVILATSTAGTTVSDYIDRTLGLGYATGSLILTGLLISTLALWHISEKSLSVSKIKTFKGELFYWIAILFSNTLGTALGDFIADNSGLGFAGGVTLISSLLLLIVIGHYFSKIPTIILFWVAFVLTRPFGATFGDLLTKVPAKGGLGYGTKGSSLVLIIILIGLIIYELNSKKKKTRNLS
jgi:uncharacterized membrane-anchored protein